MEARSSVRKAGRTTKRPRSTANPQGYEEEMNELIKIFRLSDWFQNQCEDLHVNFFYEEAKRDLIPSGDNDDVIEKLAKTNEEINHCLAKAVSSTAIATRVQLSDATFKLVGTVTKNQENVDPLVGRSDRQNNMKKILLELAEVSSKILEENTKARRLKRNISQMKEEITCLSSKRTGLTRKLEEKKEEQEASRNQVSQRIHQKTNKLCRIITINNNILQLLICYAVPNWHKKRNLSEIVMQCGMSLEEQMTNASE